MPVQAPNWTSWTPGEDIQSDASIKKLNDNIEMFRVKFDHLVPQDLDLISNAATFTGTIDLRGNMITNVREVNNVINLEQYILKSPTGHTIQTAIDSLKSVGSDEGGVVFLPPHYTYEVDNSITMKSGVQVVGSGPSSVLRLSSSSIPSKRQMFNCVNIRNFAIRDMHLQGNRLTVNSATAIFVKNSGTGIMQNLLIGMFDNSTSKRHGWSEDGIRIRNDSRDMILDNITIRGCTGSGGARPVVCNVDCTRVMMRGLVIENNEYYGIRISNGCSHVTVADSVLSENGTTNLAIERCSRIKVFNNTFSNASTTAGNTDSNIHVGGAALTPSNAIMIFENEFVERPNRIKTTSFHVDIGANSNSHLVIMNWFHGLSTAQTVRINSSVTVFRDMNHMHEGGYRWASFNKGGFWTRKGLAGQELTWNSDSQALAPPSVGFSGGTEDTRAYETTYAEQTRDDAGPPAGGEGYPYYLTAGDFSNATEIDMKRAQEIFGNRGSMLTPNFLVSKSTAIEDEVVGLQATYNIVQQVTHVNPPGGNGRPAAGTATAVDPTDEFRGFWDRRPVTVNTNDFTRMDNSVLTAYITNTESTHIWCLGASKVGMVFHRPTWLAIKG